MYENTKTIVKVVLYIAIIMTLYHLFLGQCSSAYQHMLSDISTDHPSQMNQTEYNQTNQQIKASEQIKPGETTLQNNNSVLTTSQHKKEEPFQLQDTSSINLDMKKMYIAVIKRYISQNFKEFQFIILPLMDILELCIPTTLLNSLFGLIPLVFSLIFGGGLNYFNRSIKQLNKHSCKIQKGIDFKAEFIKQSENIIKMYEDSIQLKEKDKPYTFFKRNHSQFNEIQNFITNHNFSIKVIESRERKDLSLMLYHWIKHNFSCCQEESFYLSLKVPPFNHEESSNSHVSILESIMYSILHKKDRSKSLWIIKTMMKIVSGAFYNLKWFLTQDWNEVQLLALMLGACQYYYFHQILKTLIFYLPCKLIVQLFKSKRTSQTQPKLTLSKKFIILDNFECMKSQLKVDQFQKGSSQRENIVQANKILFESILESLHRINSSQQIQIVIIIQQTQFYQPFMRPYSPHNDERNYDKKQLDPYGLKDLPLLSEYLSIQRTTLKYMLASLNDQRQLLSMKNLSISDLEHVPLEIFRQVIKKNITKLDQLITNQRRDGAILFLKRMIDNQILDLCEQVKEQVEQSRITEQIMKKWNKLYSSMLEQLNYQPTEANKIICNLFKLMFNTRRGKYFACPSSSLVNEEQRKLVQLLKGACILYDGQFYSKSQQISAYFYLIINKAT